MRIEHLRDRLRGQGALPAHEHRVLRLWANAQPQASGKRKPEDFLPLRVRALLPQLEADLQALAQLRSKHPAGDGSVRLLVALSDGQSVESVLLPRGGLCVSTQVGCAVGCVFCMTGVSLDGGVTGGEAVRSGAIVDSYVDYGTGLGNTSRLSSGGDGVCGTQCTRSQAT